LVPFLRTKDANQQNVTALILYVLIMIMLCEIASESNADKSASETYLLETGNKPKEIITVNQ